MSEKNNYKRKIISLIAEITQNKVKRSKTVTLADYLKRSKNKKKV